MWKANKKPSKERLEQNIHDWYAQLATVKLRQYSPETSAKIIESVIDEMEELLDLRDVYLPARTWTCSSA